MVANAVDDASAFEVDREIAVVPAADGGLADRGVFFVGQAETLRFEVRFEQLAFIDANEQAVVEPGEFEVMVGGSSRKQDLLREVFQYRP